MKLNLPASILTPQDLRALMLEVRNYSRWFSHGLVMQRAATDKISERPVLTPAAIAVIKDWAGGQPLSQASLDGLIEALEEFEELAPQLTITLAAPAAGGLKRSLAAWCRQNIAPNILINFEFDSTLLGGLVVRYGSRIFDWSFRRQILAGRAKFPEVLRNV